MKTIQTITMTVLMCLAAFGAQAQCSASFTSSNSPANPAMVSFTSTVSGFQANFTTYAWTFYDMNGNVMGNSYTANPTHTYNANGAYSVCLTVTDSICSNTYCDSVLVSGSSNPCAGFGISFTSSTTANGTSFVSTVSGGTSGYQYTWDFGDNNFSSVANPTHGYANGSYIACVTVYDANGCSFTQCDSVIVGGGANPCAGVTASFTSSTAGSNVTYLQASLANSPHSNDPYDYTWTIGGATYTGKNLYFQAATGVYIACLTVTDTLMGCSITTYCDSILVTSNSNPCAGFTTDFSFSANPMLPTVGQFNSTVSGGTAPYTYVWTVGNTTVTTSNPSWQFPGNGAYSVCLAVYDANGCIATKCDSVLLSNSTGNPCAGLSTSFTYTDDSTAVNSGYFTSSVSGGTAPYAYSWTINGANSTNANPYYQFNSAGTYNICLTVTDANGCATTSCNTVVVGGGNPCGNISVSYNVSQNTTNPFVLYLQPVITGTNMNPANSGLDFIWTWGDNTGTIGGAMPSHQYGITGAYVVCLTVIDSLQGCAYTFCDTINMDSLGNFSRNAGGFIINTVPAQYSTITGIEDNRISAQSTMALFPNPAHNTLNISLNSVGNSDAQLTVFDLNGQQLISKVVNVAEGEQQLTLPVSDLPAGMYIVRMQGEQLQHTEKFIKQ